VSDFMSDFLLKIELFVFYFVIFSLIFSESSGKPIQLQPTIEPELDIGDPSPGVEQHAATATNEWEEELNRDLWETKIPVEQENSEATDSEFITGDEFRRFSKTQLLKLARALSGDREIHKAYRLKKDALIEALINKKATRTELTALTALTALTIV
jgi:hypothetical protein